MTITELAKKWGTEIETLLYRASIGELIVGIQDYGKSHTKTCVGCEPPLEYEGDPLQCEFVGVLSLSAESIERLANEGSALLEVAYLHRTWGGKETVIFEVPRAVKIADLVVPMVEVAKHDSQKTEESAKGEGVLSEKKETTLLKQIGALALVIAKNNAYKFGDKPNKLAIANAAIEAVETLPAGQLGNLNTNGLGPSSIRANITKGIDLLEGA
jgi:hypothetical protein